LEFTGENGRGIHVHAIRNCSHRNVTGMRAQLLFVCVSLTVLLCSRGQRRGRRKGVVVRACDVGARVSRVWKVAGL